MFEAHGDADKARGDVNGSTFVGGKFGVSGTGWVGGDAPGVPEVGGEGEHFQPVEEFAAGFEAAF